MPIGISKPEDVFGHDKADVYHDCFVRDGGETLAVALEIITDDAESMCGLDVSIHRDGVGGEQLCVRWKIQGDDEIFQFLGAGYVGVLGFSYNL